MENMENKKTIGQLKSELSQFSGTFHYYKLTLIPNVLFTDGMAFLANEASCFWLMDLIAINLTMVIKKDHPQEDFSCIKFEKTEGDSCVVIFEDGNDNELFRQDVEYTDLEFEELKFFGQFDGEKWVVMLPSEY